MSTSSDLPDRNTKSLSDLYFEIYPGIKVALDTAKAVIEITSEHRENFKNITKILSSISAAIPNLTELSSKIAQVSSETMLPILESFREAASQIDWEGLSRISDLDKLRNNARLWGSYGWSISRLTLAEMRNPPISILEADKIYDRRISNKTFQSVIERIDANISRKKDFQECVELYNKRRYKPCAMGLCALIEGQLVMTMPKNKKRRTGKIALESVPDENCNLIKVLRLENTIETYQYFFKNGNNFNRGIEGELNRNFLMHGMMYKPVKKRSCIKLFLLLEAIIVNVVGAEYIP